MRVLELASPPDTLVVRSASGEPIGELQRSQILELDSVTGSVGAYRITGFRLEADHPADPAGRHVVVEMVAVDEPAEKKLRTLRETTDEVFAFRLGTHALSIYAVATPRGVGAVFWPLDEYRLV